MNAMNLKSFLDTKKPIEFFFPRLATLNAVGAALRKEFADRTPAIITKLQMRQPLVDDELHAHDIIDDLVTNESEVIKTRYRFNPDQKDDEQKEWVNIMRFGSGRRHYVYWFQLPEGGEDGYFDSMKAAILYADVMHLT